MSKTAGTEANSAATAASAAGVDRRSFQWLALGASCAAIALAAILQTGRDDRVAFSGLPQYPLPPTCMSRQWLGVPCPGCGLTRSFVHLAHGRWESAWSAHRLGFVLAAIVALQVPYRVALLAGCRPWFGARASGWLILMLLIALGGNWFWNLLVG